MSQLAPLVFGSEPDLHAHARPDCDMFADPTTDTYWSVPRSCNRSGPWLTRGHHVDPDPTPPHGLTHPAPYDWADE